MSGDGHGKFEFRERRSDYNPRQASDCAARTLGDRTVPGLLLLHEDR